MAKKKQVKHRYLYVPKEGLVKVRFVGHQQEMFQYFNKSHFNGNYPQINNPLVSALNAATVPMSSENNVFFREDDNGDNAYTRAKRIVSLVIDRDDDTVKAFACPISVWNQVTEHPKDSDFEISRTGLGLNTRYHVKSLGISEVSESKEKSISATLDSYTFSDIFINEEWEVVDEVVERIENRWQILDL